jgi:hypothetical protein
VYVFQGIQALYPTRKYVTVNNNTVTTNFLEHLIQWTHCLPSIFSSPINQPCQKRFCVLSADMHLDLLYMIYFILPQCQCV